MPELELRVLDEFNECDEKSPWMRSVDNEPLQQHTRDLLLDRLRVRLRKQVQQSAAEIVRVTVWIAQLIGNGIQEQISTCTQAQKPHNVGDLQQLNTHYFTFHLRSMFKILLVSK